MCNKFAEQKLERHLLWQATDLKGTESREHSRQDFV